MFFQLIGFEVRKQPHQTETPPEVKNLKENDPPYPALLTFSPISQSWNFEETHPTCLVL